VHLLLLPCNKEQVMTKTRVIAICAFIALFASAHGFLESPAQADGPKPGAPASLSAPAFTFSFYERTTNQPGTGSPTDTGPIVTLPNSVGPGYVVIMDCGNPTVTADRNNVSNWSDVLHFIDSGEGARTAQLLSAGGAMPSLATVLANPNVFMQETQAGTGLDDTDNTVFNAGNIYNVHSAASRGCAPAQVPEGDTLMLVGTGLAGLAGYAGLRWRARRAQQRSSDAV
jgi:hypothetical protein